MFTGGGVRSVQLGGGGGQVQPAGGGSGPAAGGQVQPGGGSGPAGGGVSILRPLAGGMPLAFTQEDFLVAYVFGVRGPDVSLVRFKEKQTH